jgi:hypothetical protein
MTESLKFPTAFRELVLCPVSRRYVKLFVQEVTIDHKQTGRTGMTSALGVLFLFVKNAK